MWEWAFSVRCAREVRVPASPEGPGQTKLVAARLVCALSDTVCRHHISATPSLHLGEHVSPALPPPPCHHISFQIFSARREKMRGTHPLVLSPSTPA